MNPNEVDILLVDDSQDDVDLTLHALRAENQFRRTIEGPARMGPGTEQEIQGFLAIARDEDTIGQVFRA